MNLSFLPQPDQIPQQACEFYYGYYSMSVDMGGLLIKLLLLYLVFDVVKDSLVWLWKHYRKVYKDNQLIKNGDNNGKYK